MAEPAYRPAMPTVAIRIERNFIVSSLDKPTSCERRSPVSSAFVTSLVYGMQNPVRRLRVVPNVIFCSRPDASRSTLHSQPTSSISHSCSIDEATIATFRLCCQGGFEMEDFVTRPKQTKKTTIYDLAELAGTSAS